MLRHVMNTVPGFIGGLVLHRGMGDVDASHPGVSEKSTFQIPCIVTTLKRFGGRSVAMLTVTHKTNSVSISITATVRGGNHC